MIRSTRRWRLPALAALGALSAGTVGLTAGTAGATPEFAITRIFGDTRAATAAAIAANTYPSGSDNAFLVREDEFADALAGNYLAGLINGPILLVQTNAIPPATATALQSLDVENVTLLGGTTAISDGVAAGLASAGLEVDRIAGTDRFDTAARIARGGALLPNGLGTDANGDRVAFVSSGRNFPDALSAGPLVFSQHFPQLLTEPNSLPASTLSALTDLQIDRVYLTGGVNAIAANVETALTTAGITVTRIFGNTRYETSLKIAQEAGAQYGYEADHLNFATGVNFPDALAGGPHAGTEKNPILLVPNVATGADYDFACATLEALAATVTSGHVFGGVNAVPDAVLNGLEECGGGDDTTPAPGSGQIVAVNTAGNTYTFVQSSDNAVRTVSYNDNDTFRVDSTTATTPLANFESNITVGDTIKYTDDTTAADVDVHELTNATVLAGIVGDVNITTNTFSIINPVTGTAVGGPFTYIEASDVFGTTPAAFEADINEGDTVTVAINSQTNVKTIALTNATVSGTVTDVEKFANDVDFQVNGNRGDEFDASGDDDYVASLTPTTGTETYSIGGATGKTFAEFLAAISNGDTITVARAGNIEAFALTNGAPPLESGQAYEIDAATDTLTFLLPDGTDRDVIYTNIGNLTVNGNANAGPADLEAAFSPGDTVTYRLADANSSTSEALTLTDANLKGRIDNVDTAADTYDVLAADNTTVLDTVNYAGDLYKVNGATKTVGDFETAIAAEDGNDTIEFNATTTEHSFTTVA